MNCFQPSPFRSHAASCIQTWSSQTKSARCRGQYTKPTRHTTIAVVNNARSLLFIVAWGYWPLADAMLSTSHANQIAAIGETARAGTTLVCSRDEVYTR